MTSPSNDGNSGIARDKLHILRTVRKFPFTNWEYVEYLGTRYVSSDADIALPIGESVVIEVNSRNVNEAWCLTKDNLFPLCKLRTMGYAPQESYEERRARIQARRLKKTCVNHELDWPKSHVDPQKPVKERRAEVHEAKSANLAARMVQDLKRFLRGSSS